MSVRSTVVALSLALLASTSSMAQEVNSPPTTQGLPATINVFLDCSHSCDFDFIRTEILNRSGFQRGGAHARVHVARQLLSEGRNVIGLDSLNDYYDPALKQSRLNILRQNARFGFVQTDLADRPAMAALFAKHRFEVVVHLAGEVRRDDLGGQGLLAGLPADW